MRALPNKFISISSSIVLTITSLIGIPLKAFQDHKYQPKCLTEPLTVWTPYMIKVYTRGLMALNYPQWNRSEWRALVKLWDNESHWNAQAYNHSADKWSGKHAAGVAQMLGEKTTTPAPQQVARGLSYIFSRYGSPSRAWSHERKHGWY